VCEIGFAKYVRPYSKGQKNDFRDAEAIAEAVLSRPEPNIQIAISIVENSPDSDDFY
jgi:hypothetical protein